MYLKNSLIVFLFISLVLSCDLISIKKNNSLVSAAYIDQKMKRGEALQIVDVRTEYEFIHSHIPGAQNIYRDDLLNDRDNVDGMAKSKDDLRELLSLLGINSDDTIYLYDSRGNVDASRLWWMFELYGHEKVALIDGGFIQWRLKGYETEEGPVFFKPSRFLFLDQEKPALLAMKKDIVNKTHQQIIDARSLEEYNGVITKNGAVRAGHIPKAIRFDYLDMLDGGSFKFKSKEQLLRLMDGKGIDTKKSIVTYCHSGVRSALALFVFKEILSIDSVANYDGSWIEWSQDESLPIEK